MRAIARAFAKHPCSLLIAMMLGACGGRTEWSGDPQLHGVALIVESGAESYVNDLDFKARVLRMLELSAAYTGHDPEELHGLRVIVKPGRFPCGASDARGCYDPDDNTVRIAAAATCIENSVMPHELVHYLHGGDSPHRSAEFRLWYRLWYFKALWKEIHSGTSGECARYADVYSGQWAGPEMRP